jgi:predicted PurR-regulated permease PerM
MEQPVSAPDPLPLPNRERALGIIATATLLALLYFARDVLVPITLAVILSLLIAPLVRVLRGIGFGHIMSVLAAVLVLAFSFAAVAGVIGSQLVHMAQSLPRYERTIQHKLKTLNDVTVGKFNELTGQAGRFTNRHPAAAGQPAAPQQSGTPDEPGTPEPPQGAGW